MGRRWKRAGLRGQLLLYSLLIVTLAVGLAWGGTRYALHRAFNAYRTQAVTGQVEATAEAAAELLLQGGGQARNLLALSRVTSTRIRWLDADGTIRFDTGSPSSLGGGPRGPLGRWGPMRAARLARVEGEALTRTLPGTLGQVEVRPVGVRGVFQPRDVAFREEIDRALLLAALAALGLAAAASWVGARVVGRPIERMSEAIRALPSHLPDPVPEEGPAEVRSLARGLNAMNRRIHRLERLRRESQGAVAHQLRTPLAALKGYLAALRDLVVPPEEALEQMERAVARLDRLADELGRLNRAERLELGLALEGIAWDQFLAQAAEDWRLMAEGAGVRLNVSLPPPVTVEGDPEALAEAVGNIVENAVRYTPQGGEVVLRGGADAAFVWLEVEDSGPGIPPEDRPFIFERFYRGQEASRLDPHGTGIGLPIARQLIEAHGGTLELASAGPGSLFRIRLPRRSAPRQGTGGEVRPRPSSPGSAGR